MMGIVFWLGLFWRKTTVIGAWAATLTAFAVWCITTTTLFIDFVAGLPMAETCRFVFEKQGQAEIYLPWQMIFYLSAGTIAGIVVSLFTKPVAINKLELFYALVRTPVRKDETILAPCTLPEGTIIPPKRNLIQAGGLEIPVPSLTSIIGFTVGWMVAGGIILFMYRIAQGGS